MGVLPCRRKDCEEIMCQTYIPQIGYICSSCILEFKNGLESEGIQELPENELVSLLETFLSSRKVSSDIIAIDDFFYNHKT